MGRRRVAASDETWTVSIDVEAAVSIPREKPSAILRAAFNRLPRRERPQGALGGRLAESLEFDHVEVCTTHIVDRADAASLRVVDAIDQADQLLVQGVSGLRQAGHDCQ